MIILLFLVKYTNTENVSELIDSLCYAIAFVFTPWRRSRLGLASPRLSNLGRTSSKW